MKSFPVAADPANTGIPLQLFEVKREKDREV
jgi:hypothetical protein